MKIHPILHFRAWVFLLAFTLFYSEAFSQSSSGPRNGSTFADDNSTGSYTFSFPGNAALADNNQAIAIALASLLTGTTHYLKATGFGFSLPPTAVITGISFDVRKSAQNINFLTSVEDNIVRLVKNGSITGSNRAKAPNWTSTAAYHTYGSSSDLWGTTWTAADINSANFGLVFSARINGIISLLPNAEIDHIRATVYYNIVLPVSLIDFTAEPKENNKALLRWTATTDEESASINLQRMTAQNEWKTIYTTMAKRRTLPGAYEYTDLSATAPIAYYRLQFISGSGKITYSKVLPLKWLSQSLGIFPNPASHTLYVDITSGKNVVTITGMNGQQWAPRTQPAGNLYTIDISHLPPGMYTLSVGDRKEMFVKK